MAINTDLLETIKQLSEKSKAGIIRWEKINPSTFKWVREDEGSYVTLQRVDATGIRELMLGLGDVKYNYVLQAISDDGKTSSEEDGKKIIFKLSSADKEEYNVILKELFDAIYNGIEKSVANLLGGFLK